MDIVDFILNANALFVLSSSMLIIAITYMYSVMKGDIKKHRNLKPKRKSKKADI